jgi:hypothetical protein
MWLTGPSHVIARLDPKSGLPDFGIKLSKSETSDFDAIQYPRPVVTSSPPGLARPEGMKVGNNVPLNGI